jgi:hypothetical protein
MKQKSIERPGLSAQEIQFIERLRRHPLMAARFQSILEIAGNAEGPLKTADAVEDLVVEELRQLGQAALGEWAVQAEERASAELRERDPRARSRKKKRCSGGVSSGW